MIKTGMCEECQAMCPRSEVCLKMKGVRSSDQQLKTNMQNVQIDWLKLYLKAKVISAQPHLMHFIIQNKPICYSVQLEFIAAWT